VRGPLRIAHVTPTYAPCIGGSERMTQAVSERLAARGHQVTVLTFDCASQRDLGSPLGAGLPAAERLNGVSILRHNPVGGGLARLHRWWRHQRGGYRTSRWLFGEDWRFLTGRPNGMGMIRPILDLSPSVVVSINWCFGVAYWTSLAARLGRIPHVGIPVMHFERPWAQREVYRSLLRQSRAALALTEAEAEFFRSRGARNALVAGAGVDPARFAAPDGAAIRARLGLGNDPVVSFVGRQDILKGVPTLIEAMSIVWQAVPETALLLAGPAAHRDEHVTAALETLDPIRRSRIRFLDDFAEGETPSIMAASDLLAQPSVEDGFGLVLVEAWACERPVIGCDIAATRMVIDHGRDGWLVQPFQPVELAGRILQLLRDPGMRQAFGRAGREKVLARFTWDRVTDHWEDTYRGVVEGRLR
jgi:glycosyltransferase involved in cell wall biosynthesis